ncbi:hypothetical protein IV417_00875 [Alphaproteobacteria bacterium KMM 3653]|uniref:N-acetyltransferase domain-containing protein n=1 Tax=Harenicola maris TaxID=2841044 RepID=A0AAP2CK48_9RHOB|nr:hypothetical protein [Harenicola maris]
MTQVFEHGGARAKLYWPGPLWGALPCACIGNWSCPDAATGAALLATIEAAAKAQGAKALLGPMDGDTWHSYRLVSETDGTPPFLMEPTSKPYDMQAFETAGFNPIEQYFSARAPIAAGLADSPPAIPGLTLTQWDGTDPEGHFAMVHDLSTRAFAGNLFYTPIPRETFVQMYMPFVPMLRPEMVLFARDDTGALAGFLFGVPNYAEGPETKTAILKTYAGLARGVGRHLVHRFHTACADQGFTQVIHGLIHDDNRSAERSRQAGGEIFRRYALMGKRL